jgi:hypothetical protein
MNGRIRETREGGGDPGFGWFVGLVVPVQEIFVLPWLLLSAQYKIFFRRCPLFQFVCPHRQAIWAGCRAGSPVSYYVSLGRTVGLLYISRLMDS